MKNLIKLLFISLILGFNTITVLASDVITPKDFAKIQKSKQDLVIIDATSAASYAEMHLTGAINIPSSELNKKGKIAGLIKDPKDIAAYLGEKGISNESEIVIYDDGAARSASRVYWVLKYVGAENVKILHKDMDAWKTARLRLSKAVPSVKPTVFTLHLNPAIYASMAEVKNDLNKPGVALVDCRTDDEYNGSIQRSKGHLPGAIHAEYTEVLKANGDFKTKEELNTLAEKLGLINDKTIILYCATSVRATVSFVAFSDILGLKNVKVYDGAYNEWAADPANKIE